MELQVFSSWKSAKDCRPIDERTLARGRGRRKDTSRTPSSLWKRAAGALKDKHSLYLAKIASRRGFRNPDLEEAIIKATDHDEFTIDYRNAQRVFVWLRTSPASIKPIVWALARRMEKTRSWVVALKGLMLTHGVFCVRSPALKNIGRLPFDLSRFEDRSTGSADAWALSAFIRSYFTFLDQSSTFLSYSDDIDKEAMPMYGALVELQRSQSLLDLLVQIRPSASGLKLGLILEAMDCVVIEIFDVYSGICSGIATVLARIFTANSLEASMALTIIQKATLQYTQLQSFFEVCKSMGVLNATELPTVELIPNEDVQDLERIICGASGRGWLIEENSENPESNTGEMEKEMDWKDSSGTIVTKNWVVFRDDESQCAKNKREDSAGPSLCHLQKGLQEWQEFSKWQQQQRFSLLHCGSAMEESQRNLIHLF